MRTFYRMQLHPGDPDYDIEKIKKILKEHCVIGLDVEGEVSNALGLTNKPLTEWTDEDFKEYDELDARKSGKKESLLRILSAIFLE